MNLIHIAKIPRQQTFQGRFSSVFYTTIYLFYSIEIYQSMKYHAHNQDLWQVVMFF